MDKALVLELPNDISSIEHAVEYVMRHCSSCTDYARRLNLNFRVGLTEALSNAMLYGNGSDPEKRVRVEVDVSVEEAAVREVSEECGVPLPVITGALETTEHFYKEPQTGRLVLKRTHWFAMAEGESDADAAEALTPQIEEGITQAVWANCSQ
ncbi:MAG TPA: hypothetical protein EYQ64_09905, partial [Gemmatimonadetes bacterium]|nr:hypothetical protein [Gemmatimonadota bacterium]